MQHDATRNATHIFLICHDLLHDKNKKPPDLSRGRSPRTITPDAAATWYYVVYIIYITGNPKLCYIESCSFA